MRLRKKPWIEEALNEYEDIAVRRPNESYRGRWRRIFQNEKPLYVELGTGKGRFITELAAQTPEVNFIGIEAQQDVLYYAAQKVRDRELPNVRLLVFDINQILEIFSPGEIDRLYINFCDPWPKTRHAKRRLTHAGFLQKYRTILVPGGNLILKTDNRPLFDYSLEQFRESGLAVDCLTYDLHHPAEPGHADNIMTEYEVKFSSLGVKINRAVVGFPKE